MSDLEKLPNREDKLSVFQKKYNLTSKNVVHVIGTNISLFICILLPLMLIGFIWTDFGVPEIGVKYISDGVVTVVTFVVGEMMMMRVGADGGKLDTEYISAKKTFTELVERIQSIGTAYMNEFCDAQIEAEMSYALSTRLRSLRIDADEWETVQGMTESEIVDRYGKKKGREISELKKLEPIQLDEGILMRDGDVDMNRGGVPISAEGYMRKQTHSAKMILSCIFTGLLTVSVAITITSDITFARVMYTFFKMVVLLYRMAVGYDIGARAYNTIAVRQLGAKCAYLRSYEVYVRNKKEEDDKAAGESAAL